MTKQNNATTMLLDKVDMTKKIILAPVQGAKLLSPIKESLTNQVPKTSTAQTKQVTEPVADTTKIKPIISLQNVNVKYNLGKVSEFHALKDINFDIYPGEFVIFFGPSGCGKSTLTNVVAGLERICSGKVIVGGLSLNDLSDDQLADYHTTKIGFVFQAYNLIDSLSIIDNVALPQAFTRQPLKLRLERATQALQRFKMVAHTKKMPVMLSGGQQQRVGIARALVNNPDIILADEPVGNLDSASAEMVIQIFQDLTKIDKKTVILVTHNQDLLKIANRIIHILDGRVIREEINDDIRPEEVKNKERKESDPDFEIPSELKILMRTYGALTMEQLNTMWIPMKAKIITERILQKYSKEQRDSIENVIRKRLMNLASRDELINSFDQPIDQGGAELDSRTATNLANKVEEIMHEAEKIKEFVTITRKKKPLVSQEQNHAINEAFEQEMEEARIIIELRQQILHNFDGHVNINTLTKLDSLIKQRLKNKIDKNEFIGLASKPISRGGAGFRKSMARKFARDLELVILIKFGEEHQL